jgi:SnoaL-like domain
MTDDVMLTQGNGAFEWTERHYQNLATKQKLVDSLFVNDWDAFAETVTDDVKLIEPDALPFGGTYVGIAGFKEAWAKIPQVSHKTTAIATLHTYMTANPDHLWVELDCKMTRNDNGESMDRIVMEKFEFKGGKISAIILYWDNIPADLKAAPPRT